MLYVWIGFLKAGADPVSASVQQQTNDFLAQPLIKIHSAGPLRGPSGDREGALMIFEHESRESAEEFVSESPYLNAGLYEDHRLYEYQNEVG